MKYIVDIKLVQPDETYLIFNEHEMDFEKVISVKGFNNYPVPVILATIPAQDFSEVINELSKFKGSNYHKWENFESAISILRTLSVSINKSEGEG